MADRAKMMDERINKLLIDTKLHGIGVCSTDDGAIYGFTKEKLELMLKECEQSKEGMVIVFVKTVKAADIPERAQC